MKTLINEKTNKAVKIWTDAEGSIKATFIVNADIDQVDRCGIKTYKSEKTAISKAQKYIA